MKEMTSSDIQMLMQPYINAELTLIQYGGCIDLYADNQHIGSFWTHLQQIDPSYFISLALAAEAHRNGSSTHQNPPLLKYRFRNGWPIIEIDYN
jgi:hypothetical protein